MTAGRAGCALLAWPFLELFVLLWAAATWGWQPIALAIAISFLAGLLVVRIGVSATGRSWSQALRTLQQRQVVIDPETHTVLAIESGAEATGGAPNMAPPAQTMLLIPAGMALAVPGFISDVAGLVLIIPAVRRRIAARWAAGLGPA